MATSAKVYTYILVCYRIAITSRYMKAIYILPEICDVQILEELGLDEIELLDEQPLSSHLSTSVQPQLSVSVQPHLSESLQPSNEPWEIPLLETASPEASLPAVPRK